MLGASVKVLARIRPFLPHEEKGSPILRCVTPTTVELLCDDTTQQYSFDSILDASATQADVFRAAEMDDLIAKLLQGYNVTTFAYGQTGSGKTYTMDGLDHTGLADDKVTGRARDDTNGNRFNSNDGGDRPILQLPSPEQEGFTIRCVKALFNQVSNWSKTSSNSSNTSTNANPNTPSLSADANLRDRESESKRESCDPGATSRPALTVASEADPLNPLQPHNTEFTIGCSFLQIYQESVSDLLSAHVPSAGPSKFPSAKTRSGVSDLVATEKRIRAEKRAGLPLRWCEEKEFFVEGLYQFECRTAEDAIAYLISGLRRRVVGSHNLNQQSSRSHCIFTLTVRAFDPARPASAARQSKLCLVDLAGSERAAHTGAEGGALKQAAGINTSLLVLRKVIAALAKGNPTGGKPLTATTNTNTNTYTNTNTNTHSSTKAQLAHVPFRDSVLTRLLKQSLGGNCFTVMLACLCPLPQFARENKSTLAYAALAKSIVNKCAIQVRPTPRDRYHDLIVIKVY
jgi:hypothetical protein